MGKSYEFMCTHCGKRVLVSPVVGRPQPGNCPRRPKYSNGQPQPHRWIKVKVLGG